MDSNSRLPLGLAARLEFVKALMEGVPICDEAGRVVERLPLIDRSTALRLLDIPEVP